MTRKPLLLRLFARRQVERAANDDDPATVFRTFAERVEHQVAAGRCSGPKVRLAGFDEASRGRVWR